jgi:hypothetical protein
MPGERGGYVPPEARKNGRSLEEIRGDASLSELLHTRDAAQRSRELLTMARSDAGKGSDRSPEISASKEGVKVYQNLLERGETPEQIAESAEQNLAAAERALDKIADGLKDVPAYQELVDAEERLQSETLRTDAEQVNARRDIAPPTAFKPATNRPFGNARMMSREEVLKGLTPEERKTLGLEDDKAA